MAASFNTFKVLSPIFKETYGPTKLKKPKVAKPPKIPGVKMPKIVTPGSY